MSPYVSAGHLAELTAEALRAAARAAAQAGRAEEPTALRLAVLAAHCRVAGLADLGEAERGAAATRIARRAALGGQCAVDAQVEVEWPRVEAERRAELVAGVVREDCACASERDPNLVVALP